MKTLLKNFVSTRYKVRAIFFLIMLIALFLSSFIETVVMHDNTSNGLYQTEEEFDLVRIPMMFGGMVQFISFFFFALSLAFPRTKYWSVPSFLMLAVVLYLILGTVGYWLRPSHFSIALGYMPSAIVAIFWGAVVWFVRRSRIEAHLS